MLELGILKTFNSGTHKAGVQLVGSLTTYLDNISVSVSIPSSAMVVGNYVLVAIPGGNPRDACVVASWPAGSSGGGGEGKTYVAIAAPTAIWKSNTVSSTPRTATVSSISGDKITLTANEAYRFGDWGASPDYMHSDNVLLRIQNNTRGEWAWVKGSPSPSQLTVTNADDINGWFSGDVLRAPTQMELDISPLVPAGATAVYVKDKVKDTAACQKGCYLYKNVDSTVAQNAWTQEVGKFIAFFMIALIDDTNRHIAVKEVAGGTDTLTSVVNVLGYFI